MENINKTISTGNKRIGGTKNTPPENQAEEILPKEKIRTNSGENSKDVVRSAWDRLKLTAKEDTPSFPGDLSKPYLLMNPDIKYIHKSDSVLAYNWQTAQVTTSVSQDTSGVISVKFQPSSTGDTVFLPYGLDQIHTIYLPVAPMAEAGIKHFTTANMSGCRLYIDKVEDTEDLVIYHANALNTSPTSKDKFLRIDEESEERQKSLDNLHLKAQSYWKSDHESKPTLNLVKVCSLDVSTYYKVAAEEESRVNSSFLRKNAYFNGGTTVAGTLTSEGWHISWQTFGSISYDNTITSSRESTKNKVLKKQQIYPVSN